MSLNVVFVSCFRDQADDIKTDLESWIPKNIIADRPTPYAGNSPFEGSLEKIFFPSEPDFNKIKFALQKQPVKDYLESLYIFFPLCCLVFYIVGT